jgi:hypothetical protein
MKNQFKLNYLKFLTGTVAYVTIALVPWGLAAVKKKILMWSRRRRKSP